MVHSAVKMPVDEIAQLCRRHHILRLAVFGSATGQGVGPTSDVDILVEFEPGHTPGLGFFAIQDELTRLLGRQVDLNTPGFLSPYFREEVARNAEVLYAAD